MNAKLVPCNHTWTVNMRWGGPLEHVCGDKENHESPHFCKICGENSDYKEKSSNV